MGKVQGHNRNLRDWGDKSTNKEKYEGANPQISEIGGTTFELSILDWIHDNFAAPSPTGADPRWLSQADLPCSGLLRRSTRRGVAIRQSSVSVEGPVDLRPAGSGLRGCLARRPPCERPPSATHGLSPVLVLPCLCSRTCDHQLLRRRGESTATFSGTASGR
ncbi:hypothetical protein VNO77_08464 [Canavalia gladiata]|uniref:Uncharacterized protein n=1 Tax=Canavalia gladiata TaxID=3824 RepID=A0AAN9M985_CANGL